MARTLATGPCCVIVHRVLIPGAKLTKLLMHNNRKFAQNHDSRFFLGEKKYFFFLKNCLSRFKSYIIFCSHQKISTANLINGTATPKIGLIEINTRNNQL